MKDLLISLRSVEERYKDKVFGVGELRIGDMAKECADAIEKLQAENARLREENDLQRASIQELSKQVAKLQLTLQEIANPIKFLQQRADEQGGKLNGLFAINLATDAGYLKGLAKKALAEIETKPEPFKPSSYKDSRQMHRIEKEGRA